MNRTKARLGQLSVELKFNKWQFVPLQILLKLQEMGSHLEIMDLDIHFSEVKDLVAQSHLLTGLKQLELWVMI